MNHQTIGQGATAVVHPWGEDRVIKLFHEEVSPSLVERESVATHKAKILGLPVPKVHGTTVVQGKIGILFDRIEGYTLAEEIFRQPDKVHRLARSLATLHQGIHLREGTDLPPQKEQLKQRIRNSRFLSESNKRAVLDRLVSLPEGNRFCHGDFHPDNILVSPRGMVIIDWMTACCGHPAADAARTLLILRWAVLPGEKEALEPLRNELYQEYFRSYLSGSGCTQEQLEAWELPLIAARLEENIPETERKRLRMRMDSLL